MKKIFIITVILIFSTTVYANEKRFLEFNKWLAKIELYYEKTFRDRGSGFVVV